MRFRWRLALVIVLGCGGARTIDVGPTASGVHMRVQERFYRVHGTTVAAIQQSKRASGPELNGRRYDAYTHWSIRWRYAVRPGGAVCRLTDVRVTVDLEIELPAWTDGATAPDSLVAAWDEYVNALRTHEQGHARLSVDAANSVRDALSEFRSPCGIIREAANAEGNARLAELRRLNRRYDDETRRGAGQGAVWPP